jgi:hypothetical protein
MNFKDFMWRIKDSNNYWTFQKQLYFFSQNLFFVENIFENYNISIHNIINVKDVNVIQ